MTIDGMTPDQYKSRRDRADLDRVHRWLWAELGTPDGSPVVVKVHRVNEALIAHHLYPSPADAENYLGQLFGQGLAFHLGGQEWSLEAPPLDLAAR